MQDFEIPRHQAALQAFAEAFEEGYAEGEKDVASGAAGLADVSSVFSIDVPCDDVLDGEWERHVPMFREAGRAAAMAARRLGKAKLDPHEARDGSRTSFDKDVFRWHVILNPLAQE